LVPQDEVRGWWRYHHLFADLLRSRLRQEQPARVAALHRAAAAWHETQNLADDAVRHALAAGNPVWAAQLIERYFDAVFLPGERTTIRRWLAALPTELVGSRPRLCLAQMCVMLDDGDTRAAGIAAEAAQRASAVATGESFEPSVGRSASLLANVAAAIAAGRAWLAYLGGDADATVALATEARSKLGDADSLLNAFCQLELAVADRLRGRLDDAERGFAASVTSLVAAGARGLAAAVCGYLTEIQMCQGRLDAVLATCQLALKITTPPGEPPSPAAGIAYVAMADVYYQRGDLDAALQYVTEGIRRLRPVNYTGPLAGGLVTLAWIRQASGDTAGALDAIREAEQLAPSADVADLANPVPAQRARLLVVQGNTDAAARWTQQRSLGADDRPGYSQEREYLVLARVLLAQDRLGPARTLLDWLLTQAAAEGRVGSAIEIRALQALAHEASGDGAAAVAALAEALTLACPQGYVRVFADEGAAMRALLTRLSAARKDQRAPARGIDPGYLAGLLRACGQAGAAPPSRRAAAALPGMAEPLTDREAEVLRLLAAGRSNQRIAHELVVALDTVKKHVTHVLGKLGAANRTEAVARARQLGLIP
jgi:LuxR family maltose regulon positive regulatory protein